jgi:hypothetical protein
MIRLFLDSEWANDTARELVSLALVSEDGRHIFYAERDPLPTAPSALVRRVVYPLSERGEKAKRDRVMSERLRDFLQAFGSGEILADAPLDISMLSRVWNDNDKIAPTNAFQPQSCPRSQHDGPVGAVLRTQG